jgi:hypothetical protein
LGTTPFDLEIPSSKKPLPLLFKKASFKDTPYTLVPATSAPIEARLEPDGQAVAPEAKAPDGERAPVKAASAKSDKERERGSRPGRSSGASRSSSSKPSPKKPATSRPIDEDGVLEPTFR